jgi:hypothetical protein
MEKRKPLSGAAKRRRRREAGLPPCGERELAARVARSARATAERAAANLAFLAAFKVEQGCVDCGYNAHAAALDFDHLPGVAKVRGLSRMHTCSRAVVLREVAKCEVVCANCHRVRTWARKQSSSTAGPPSLRTELS